MNDITQPVRASRRRGRPRGSRNRTHNAGTTVVAIRAEVSDAVRIHGLLAKGRLFSRMRLTPAQILVQALDEYIAGREPQRNKSVNKFNVTPEEPHRFDDPEIQRQWDEFEASRKARREALNRDLDRIGGRADDVG
jgi:hypothetical protein